MYAISSLHNGHKVVVCFRRDTPSHYHHDAWLLACVDLKKMLAGYTMSRMCLRWGYFFRLAFCIYRVACVELAHSSLGDWKNILITHLIIIIKSEVSTFPIVVIFFRGCVSEMVVLSYSVIYYIYIPGKLGLWFHFWCSAYGIYKWSDTLWPVGRVRLFADYTISLSSLCRPIWRHWTTKMLVRYMLPSVSKIETVKDMTVSEYFWIINFNRFLIRVLFEAYNSTLLRILLVFILSDIN